ncbi:uncharacterized protein Dana_GF26564 [Drosophila ananassae]|uniref:Uncharacterized protein n=1 Tax=Drosophila ananassae TaxID=7217 RepID=A0A0P8YTB4_DROAN|nr:uncharacterized protein LOC26513973 [Drosophila ananassae]KPU81807.1 uncharacterized protein Dana_GF26564 [Drosophila ananassae]
MRKRYKGMEASCVDVGGLFLGRVRPATRDFLGGVIDGMGVGAGPAHTHMAACIVRTASASATLAAASYGLASTSAERMAAEERRFMEAASTSLWKWPGQHQRRSREEVGGGTVAAASSEIFGNGGSSAAPDGRHVGVSHRAAPFPRKLYMERRRRRHGQPLMVRRHSRRQVVAVVRVRVPEEEVVRCVSRRRR